MRVLAMGLVLLAVPGCVSVEDRVPLVLTGDPLQDGRARIAAAGDRDRVLWQYRVGVGALRRGDADEARRIFDDALVSVAGIQADAGAADAARARRLFRAEAEKPFIGEPYERVMANYYRGILYWAQGEPDNARALFRNGAFIDSDAEEKTYASDYVLLDYLDGFITQRLGGDGEDARARAQARSAFPLPAYDPDANVMLFVEYGRGPQKIASGPEGERLAFRTEPSIAVEARLRVGERVVELPPYDDLHFQATTRGGRVMDYILGNKAVFKRNADAVGDAALAAAAVVASERDRRPGRTRTPEEIEKEKKEAKERADAALALSIVGVFSKLASLATQASADTRTWENLPQYLSFAALHLPPGHHPAVLEFFDAQGERLDGRTQTFTLHVPTPGIPTAVVSPREVVVFRSELPR